MNQEKSVSSFTFQHVKASVKNSLKFSASKIAVGTLTSSVESMILIDHR